MPHVANKYNWDFVLYSIRNDSRGSNLITAVILNSVPVRNWEKINPENSNLCGCTVYLIHDPLRDSCSTHRFLFDASFLNLQKGKRNKERKEKERKKGQEKERYQIRIKNEKKMEIIEELTREKDGEGKEKERDRERKVKKIKRESEEEKEK